MLSFKILYPLRAWVISVGMLIHWRPLLAVEVWSTLSYTSAFSIRQSNACLSGRGEDTWSGRILVRHSTIAKHCSVPEKLREKDSSNISLHHIYICKYRYLTLLIQHCWTMTAQLFNYSSRNSDTEVHLLSLTTCFTTHHEKVSVNLLHSSSKLTSYRRSLKQNYTRITGLTNPNNITWSVLYNVLN